MVKERDNLVQMIKYHLINHFKQMTYEHLSLAEDS